MQTGMRCLLRVHALLWCLLIARGATASADDHGWVNLVGEHELGAWRGPTGAWFVAGDARLDSGDATRLAGVPGRGVIINGPQGRTRNLYSKEAYGDLEAHLEFL